MTRPPPSSPLFPSTTLFRSRGHAGPQVLEPGHATGPIFEAFFAAARQAGHRVACTINDHVQEGVAPAERMIRPRSEEHTSELQSHVNLVCRLLLEKKKTKQ